MSTNQKDAVIQHLEDCLVRDPESHAVKFLLYCNSNHSGLDTDKPETLRGLYNAIQVLNNTGKYNYEGTEKPLLSVSIQTRVRHAITELSTLNEILGLIRTWILVYDAKGLKWPVVPEVIPGVPAPPSLSPYPKVKMSLIRSLKSLINEALVKELPTLIDDIYRAKYKSGATFSYSLAETKFFNINNNFLTAAFEWIGKSVLQTDRLGPNDAIPFAVNATREALLWDDWFAYSYNKQRDTHKFAPNYEKLCSAICARYGKLKFAPENSKDANEQERYACEALTTALGFNNFANKDLKKKTFQVKLNEHLLVIVQNIHVTGENYPVNEKRAFISAEINKIITTIGGYLKPCGIESGLVYLDAYFYSPRLYTKQDFANVQNAFTKTGTCNDRVVNAITKFISDASLLETRHSRKKIPLSIENVIATQAKFSKIKEQSTENPSIVFSDSALASMNAEGKSKFSHLYDKDNKDSNGNLKVNEPKITGYLQQGVMSVVSSLKISSGEESEDYVLPNELRAHLSADSQRLQLSAEDVLRLYANQLDEIATLYRYSVTPILDAHKKVIADAVKLENRQKKWGVAAYNQTYNQACYMPAPVNQQQYVQPGAQSQPQVNNTMFPVATVPVHMSSHSEQPQVHPNLVRELPPPTENVGGVPTVIPINNGSSLSKHNSPNKLETAGLFGGVPVQNVPVPNGPGLFGGGNSPNSQQSSLFGAPGANLSNASITNGPGLFGVPGGNSPNQSKSSLF